MTRNGMAAYAAGNCQSIDFEDTDDMTDILSEKVVSIVRILIPDEGIRAVVLADAFAKCYVDDLYTGDVFEDIEDAKDIIEELVAGHIIDSDPMLCIDFGSCLDDDWSDVGEDCPEDVCDGPFCDWDCHRAYGQPYINKGLELEGVSVLMTRDDEDDRASLLQKARKRSHREGRGSSVNRDGCTH